MFKNGYEYIIVKRYEPRGSIMYFYLCSLLKYYFIKMSFNRILFCKINDSQNKFL